VRERGNVRRRARWVQGSLLVCAFAFSAGALGSAARDRRIRLSKPAAVLPEPRDNGSLPWTWYYGQTPRQVEELVGTENRLVSIQVRNPSPLLLDVAIVRNTGTGHKEWWWVPGAGPELGGSQLGDYCEFREGRVVSLAPYVVDGTTYFAAVLIANTGTDHKGWWWYFDIPKANIDPLITQNKARLLDLRSYGKSGATVYAVVMIPNTGPDEQKWWWYAGVNAASVRASLKDNKALLASLQAADRAGTTFDVVMNAGVVNTMPSFQGVSWLWGTNDTD
jgi:hypothetical protein